MTHTTTLLEPSFVDAVAAIERAPDLSEQTRRHWVCSLRQIAKWLDRPAAVVPARWTSVRMPVSQLHHARVGVTAKTLANHKSNVRAALRWFGKEHDVPVRGVPLIGRVGEVARQHRGPWSTGSALRADALLLGTRHPARHGQRCGPR